MGSGESRIGTFIIYHTTNPVSHLTPCYIPCCYMVCIQPYTMGLRDEVVRKERKKSHNSYKEGFKEREESGK